MTVNRSGLFRSYNLAVPLAHSGRLERGRLDRGLGLALRRAKYYHEKYGTTLTQCGCPDTLYRPAVLCKHRIAVQLLELARNPDAEPEPETEIRNPFEKPR